ncbi:hypothetical protein [Buttiauxella noackiae]|uniref:hypothetical protein n=1 Tax=Buttiauxella noackiae TaxID=82992 RepID=UPI0028D14B7B|nr:hypothetical protein [Buttiauxella noackiae]
MIKADKQRFILKLMVIALNESIKSGDIDLNGKSDDRPRNEKHGFRKIVIADRPTIINWFDAGYDELRVSVWWDYQPELMPQPHRTWLEGAEPLTSTPQTPRGHYRHFIGACGSCYLERRTGKFITGEEYRQFFDVYIREASLYQLQKIPGELPAGYATHGSVTA